MTHVRTRIRAAVVARLTGLPTTAAHVYPSRVRPVADSNLPCLLIYLDDESIEAMAVGETILERTAKLRIRVLAKASDHLDETLDQALAEVEAALSGTADKTYGGLIKSLLPDSIEIDFDDSLEKPVGSATLTCLVNYYTRAGDPTAAL